MGMENAIIIKQSYFDGNKAAVNALNEYFSSGFETKHFSDVYENYDVDPSLERIINRLDAVDHTWLTDEGKYNAILDTIREELSKINIVDGVYETIVNSNNETLVSAIDGYIGIKMLQIIADNFDEFSKLINGLYSFELFTKPSQYTDVINKFSQFIQFNELHELDLEEKIFDEGFYIDGIFKSGLIQLPDTLTVETETERMINRQDLSSEYEVYVDDENDDDTPVQEAAEINFFSSYKPAHMKYSAGSRKFIVSKEFTTVVDDFISKLRKCDTSDDLKDFLAGSNKEYARMFSKVVAPSIIVKALTNPKKANVDFNPDIFKRYTDSYKSILDQNNGARRFEYYDIFTTFKADKDGTIKFLEDFFKLKLVNEPDASISNNTLLTLFNIFDSRIYLDIIYNMAPESIKNEQTENQFVKSIRGGVNKNSRTKDAYSKANDAIVDEVNKNDEKNAANKEKTVTEYVIDEMNKLGNDMSISDMRYCEHYTDLLEREIASLDDAFYNNRISAYDVNEFIGESFNVFDNDGDDIIMESRTTKRRETLQSAVASVLDNMEKIVDLDKKHMWNDNTLVHRYKTTYGAWLFGRESGSSEYHTNIKTCHWVLGKALKGKSGHFTSEQRAALSELRDLVGDIWSDVKMFWLNPVNWTKQFNRFVSDKKKKRTKSIARTAKAIVELKPRLEFINDEAFIGESYDEMIDSFNLTFVQEATTEKNRENLKKAFAAVLKDMQDIAKKASDKSWTNNAAISKFSRSNATISNVKQLKKYCNRAEATACGKLDDSQMSSIKSLREKCEDILKTVKLIKVNPLIGKNVKESDSVHKLATIASDIVDMESTLSFINDEPIHDSSLPIKKKSEDVDTSALNDDDDNSSESSTTTESDIVTVGTLDEFIQESNVPGDIPAYMKKRLKLSDNMKTTLEKADIPDLPLNPVPDLVDSINTKVDNGGDQLDNMLGQGFDENVADDLSKSDKKHVVINITNNYTNSFNTDSNNTTTVDDHSTGKQISDSNASTNINRGSKRGYNNNNSNDSVDTKDSHSQRDKKQKLSNGKTVQEMFEFLESKEPQSIVVEAKGPVKEDLLTRSLDKDREKLAGKQETKRKVQKAENTIHAVTKPITRTKEWLTGFVDRLISRDEDKVKADLLENPSYRTALYKAMRLAISAGLVGIAFSIQPWLGIGVLGVDALKASDKSRLRKEVRRELETELKVLDKKISDLSGTNDPEKQKLKYQYMRLKSDVEKKLIQVQRAPIKTKSSESMYY